MTKIRTFLNRLLYRYDECDVLSMRKKMSAAKPGELIYITKYEMMVPPELYNASNL